MTSSIARPTTWLGPRSAPSTTVAVAEYPRASKMTNRCTETIVATTAVKVRCVAKSASIVMRWLDAATSGDTRSGYEDGESADPRLGEVDGIIRYIGTAASKLMAA